jgi:hypothetical protein
MSAREKERRAQQSAESKANPAQSAPIRSVTQKYRKKSVAARYDIDERSVDRWVADGRLPRPTYYGRIPLWDEDELFACDAVHTAASAARASKLKTPADETKSEAPTAA